MPLIKDDAPHVTPTTLEVDDFLRLVAEKIGSKGSCSETHFYKYLTPLPISSAGQHGHARYTSVTYEIRSTINGLTWCLRVRSVLLAEERRIPIAKYWLFLTWCFPLEALDRTVAALAT